MPNSSFNISVDNQGRERGMISHKIEHFRNPDFLKFSLILILSFSIPFDLSQVSIFVPVLILMISVIQKQVAISRSALILTFLFVLHIAWAIPAVTHSGSFSFLEKTLPFAAFPLALSMVRINEVKAKLVLRVFVLAVLLSYVLSLIVACYNFFYSQSPWGRQSDFFFHVQFTSGLFNIHPTYYGLMGCLATVFAFHSLTRIWKVLAVLLITVFVFLINAKIILILQVFIIFWQVAIRLKAGLTRRSILVACGACAGLIFLLWLTGTLYDYSHRRIFVNLNTSWQRSFDKDFNDGSDGGIVTRMAIWRNASAVISEQPLLGVGFGNEKKALLEKYEQSSITTLIVNQFNSHNQLLSYLISFGIIGVSLMGVLYFTLFREALLQGKIIYLQFIVVLVIIGLTESILNRLWGITLFAFFNSFFALKYLKTDE